MNKNLIILSGGLDSTILAYWIKYLYPNDELIAITYDYGQRHNIEIEKAKITCKKLNIKHEIINISFLGDTVKDVSALIKNTNVTLPSIKDILGEPQPQSVDVNSKILIKKEDKFILTTLKKCNIDDEAFGFNFNTKQIELNTITSLYVHQPNKDVYEIILKNGIKLIATDDHSIYCINEETHTDNKQRSTTLKLLTTKKTSELTKNDLLYTPHINIEQNIHINLKDWIDDLENDKYIEIDDIFIKFLALCFIEMYIVEGRIQLSNSTQDNTLLIKNISNRFDCEFCIKYNSHIDEYFYYIYSPLLIQFLKIINLNSGIIANLIYNLSLPQKKSFIDYCVLFSKINKNDFENKDNIIRIIRDKDKVELYYLLKTLNYKYKVKKCSITYHITFEKPKTDIIIPLNNCYCQIKKINKLDDIKNFQVGDISLNGSFIANGMLVHNTYVPNRNSILLSIAASFAEANNINNIYTGLQQIDAYQYWDTTPEFIKHLNNLLKLNRKNQIQTI